MKVPGKKFEKLPLAIKQGQERKLDRALGKATPFQNSPIVGKPVAVKPIGNALAAKLKPGVAPLFSGGRLTDARVIQSSRRMDAALGKKAGPKARARIDKREIIGARNAARAALSRPLTINPPKPITDRVTGRNAWTSAFPRTGFRAPFQKSFNLRRSFGA